MTRAARIVLEAVAAMLFAAALLIATSAWVRG